MPGMSLRFVRLHIDLSWLLRASAIANDVQDVCSHVFIVRVEIFGLKRGIKPGASLGIMRLQVDLS